MKISKKSALHKYYEPETGEQVLDKEFQNWIRASCLYKWRCWNEKPDEVKNMLDVINDFSVNNSHLITIFLCLIINRFKSGHTETTQFKNDVANLVAARTGDNIKIIMVDMENRVGLDILILQALTPRWL